MKSMREEILRNQDYQQQLNRWKVVLASSLFAIGIGLGAKESLVKAYYLLLGIPLVCIYVDLLFYQCTWRIFAIANFIRTYCKQELKGEDLVVQDYEAFIHNIRNFHLKDIFKFGRNAQLGSSIAFTILSPSIGAFLYLQETQDSWEFSWESALWIVILTLGIFAHFYLYLKFDKSLEDVNHLISPIIEIIDDKKKGWLPNEMVDMIRYINKYGKREDLIKLCIESYSWSNEESRKKGKKKLKDIQQNIAGNG